ncbi:MAG: family 16 glycosylhydrolase [Flavobacteriales bacterium]
MKNSFTLALCALGLSLQAKNYKGAEIYSTESVLYGKFEMCIQASKASGLLSTFFLYKNGSEQQGAAWEEIDIEIFGKNDALSFQSNIITGTNGATKSEQVHTNNSSLADDFHIYTLEWTPDYIAWYLDGEEMRKSTGAQVALCKSAMSYRFNSWISSSVPWVGTFTDTDLPVHQFVDWISYSTYTKGAGDNGSDFTFSWKDDFSTFNTAKWSKANWTFDGNLVDFEPANAITKEGKLVLAVTTSAATGFSGTTPSGSCSGTGTGSIGVDNINIYVSNHTLYLNGSNNICISDLSGKKFFSGIMTDALSLNDLSAGMYVLSINNGKVITNKKIVVD